jgi:hypothetical protein
MYQTKCKQQGELVFERNINKSMHYSTLTILKSLEATKVCSPHECQSTMNYNIVVRGRCIGIDYRWGDYFLFDETLKNVCFIHACIDCI